MQKGSYPGVEGWLLRGSGITDVFCWMKYQATCCPCHQQNQRLIMGCMHNQGTPRWQGSTRWSRCKDLRDVVPVKTTNRHKARRTRGKVFFTTSTEMTIKGLSSECKKERFQAKSNQFYYFWHKWRRSREVKSSIFALKKRKKLWKDSRRRTLSRQWRKC